MKKPTLGERQKTIRHPLADCMAKLVLGTVLLDSQQLSLDKVVEHRIDLLQRNGAGIDALQHLRGEWSSEGACDLQKQLHTRAKSVDARDDCAFQARGKRHVGRIQGFGAREANSPLQGNGARLSKR